MVLGTISEYYSSGIIGLPSDTEKGTQTGANEKE